VNPKVSKNITKYNKVNNIVTDILSGE
jgi:hypothetical protein